MIKLNPISIDDQSSTPTIDHQVQQNQSITTEGASLLKTNPPSRFLPQRPDTFVREELFDLYSYPYDKQIIQNVISGEITNEEIKGRLKEQGVYPRFAHGKHIEPNEPYFRCLDCEVLKNTNQRTYLCRECFEKKSHRGHRFLLFNDATGNETCDCGNESLLDNKYFCSDHGTCHKEESDKILEAVPKTYRKNFNKNIRQTMYEIIFACEVQRKGLQGNIKSALNKCIEALVSALRHLLTLNPVYMVLVAEVMTQKVRHPKNYKNFLFLYEKHVKRNNFIIEESLGLTYLEALIKHSLLFKEEYQKGFRELLLKLACGEEFKKKLVISFHNMAHHLFKVSPQSPFAVSNLAYLTAQIYASEENCLKVIQEGSFDQIIEVLRNYATLYQPGFDHGNKVLTRCLHLFELILEKENSGSKLVHKDGVVGKFLEVLSDFQRLHSYQPRTLSIDLQNLSYGCNILELWDFESKIFKVMEKLMKNIGYILDKEGYEEHPELFLIDWGERAMESLKLDASIQKAHLNIPLQRTMVAYLQYSMSRLETDKIINRLEYIRRACPDAIEHLIAQSLGTIGLMRQTMIKMVGFTVDANPIVERYFIQNEQSLFDYDLTFVQLFSLLLSDDETNMFELYYKSYFGSDNEIIAMFKEADFSKATEQQMQLLQDFLTFLVQLLHGEVSFFNLFYKGPYFTDHGSKKIFDQIHRKILITFLHKTYQFFSIASLKHDFRYILRGDIFHEKILKDIADVDKESKNFKLKKPYMKLYDSFYLYTDYDINQKLICNIRAANKNPEIADLGNFSQSLPFLYLLQQKLYEGQIVSWLNKFFVKFTSKATRLIPAVIRLIILPLKLLEHSKKLPVTQKFKENTVFPFFGNRSFYDKLKKALVCIGDAHIQNQLAKILNIFVPKSNIGNTTTGGNTLVLDSEDMKPSIDPNISMDPTLVLEALNNIHSPAELNPVKEWDEKDPVCGICHKRVSLNSIDVGIPCFISRSNVNLIEVKARKFRKTVQHGDKDTVRLIIFLIKRYFPYAGGLNPKDVDFLDMTGLLKLVLDFYPAFTSCMHYLHRSCFSKNYVVVPGTSQEYECPICYKLNNMFIGMEQVDSASRKMIEEQIKQNKRFLDFLKKQSVLIPMLPDKSLKFDFYNSFMHGLFPNIPRLELKPNDGLADKKIMRFANLIRASYFQLVRNSLINSFDTFMNKSYMCYKFAFVNLQGFVMKNFQFHQFFENMTRELAPTIFHILHHQGLMADEFPPSMGDLYLEFASVLGLDDDQKRLQKKEDKEAREKKRFEYLKQKKEKHDHAQHEHKQRLPEIPFFRGKPPSIIDMNERNKRIIAAYRYRLPGAGRLGDSVIHQHDLLESTRKSVVDDDLEHDHHNRSRGSASDPDDNRCKEEDLFDGLQKMMLYCLRMKLKKTSY